MKRKNYTESCLFLQEAGLLDEDTCPPLPSGPAKYDDDPPGISFFRMIIGEGAVEPEELDQNEILQFENLTLPRTFICRSELINISFRNTDLSESSLCWNDFIHVDFTDADLSNSDLRCSVFNNIKFIQTNLQKADLRSAEFIQCDFSDAIMLGVKLTPNQREEFELSKAQLEVIDWKLDDGEIPTGG